MSKSLVIIPTYNEKENIKDMIRAVFALKKSFDLLIVDDNSPDDTSGLVKEQQTQYNNLYLIERESKMGLGSAYITGFKYAIKQGYDYVFEMDADFSHNPEDLPALQQVCEVQGYDMAIGSRYIKGVNVVNWPMSRILMSYLASHYVRFITRLPVRDSTAGFKCYRRSVLETLKPWDNIHFSGYAFQIEMKFNAWKHGFKLKEIPIVFTDRTKGASKMSINIFTEAVLGVIEMKIKSLFKKYEPAHVN